MNENLHLPFSPSPVLPLNSFPYYPVMATAPDWYYQKPTNARLRTGAGGVVARLENDKVLIALIRDRGDHEFVLPKGGVEPGETLQQAAAREIHEEAGFGKLQLLDELGIGQRLAGKRNVWQTTHYFLFITDDVEARPTDRRDWEVKWFDLDHLPELYWPEQAQLVRDNLQKITQLVTATRK
jgi:8-oxo-dGTP pyrophosphatase MutT (NUDIX family)